MWSNYIPFLEFVHNSWKHSEWNSFPFDLTYSTPIIPIPKLPTSSNFPIIRDQLKLLN